MLGKPHKVAAINQPLRPTPSHPHTPPPIFQMGQWGRSRGVTWPRLNTTEPEQSQNLNGGCLDPMTGLYGTEWRLFASARMKVTVPSAISPISQHPPRQTPSPWIPAVTPVAMNQWSWAVFPARTLLSEKSKVPMLLGRGAGKKSAHKQLKQIRFLKNILLLPHTRAADGGGGSGRCPMLFCCGRRGQIPLIEPPCSAGSGGILRSDPSPLAGSFREASKDGWQGGLRSSAVQD